jgi:hypothetical protein
MVLKEKILVSVTVQIHVEILLFGQHQPFIGTQWEADNPSCFSLVSSI